MPVCHEAALVGASLSTPVVSASAVAGPTASQYVVCDLFIGFCIVFPMVGFGLRGKLNSPGDWNTPQREDLG